MFSPSALQAAVAKGLLSPWPADVAMLEETQSFWQIRDMSRYFRAALAGNPDLRVIAIGSVEDHVQGTPDYAHLVLQHQGWQEGGIPWVRLNRDAIYVAALAPGIQQKGPDNPAGVGVVYGGIFDLLTPENVADPILQLAAVLELPDRTLTRDPTPELSPPLVVR